MYSIQLSCQEIDSADGQHFTEESRFTTTTIIHLIFVHLCYRANAPYQVGLGLSVIYLGMRSFSR